MFLSLVVRGQEQEEQQEEEREIRGTGYEYGKQFCSLQPRGFASAAEGP